MFEVTLVSFRLGESIAVGIKDGVEILSLCAVIVSLINSKTLRYSTQRHFYPKKVRHGSYYHTVRMTIDPTHQ